MIGIFDFPGSEKRRAPARAATGRDHARGAAVGPGLGVDDRRSHRCAAAGAAGGARHVGGHRRRPRTRGRDADGLTPKLSPANVGVARTPWVSGRSSTFHRVEGLLALSDRGAGVPLRELALVGLTAAIITYFATGWVRALATRLGAVAYPRQRDVHVQPTPRMGGLAMYIGI